MVKIMSKEKQNNMSKEFLLTASYFSFQKKRSLKGYIYTLEVIIAISIIVLSVVSILRTPPTKPEFSTSTIKMQGFEALEYLDRKGDLKKLVFQENETELENKMSGIMPKEIGFEMEFCSYSCSEVNVPANETVVVVNYYVSGYKENYIGKKVKLWIWRKS